MDLDNGAGSDPKGDGSQGVAPPADGSQGDGGKTPGDDVVPKRQFIAALNNVTTRLDALQQENLALKAQLDAKATPKVPTRAELLKFVDAGDLTQEQADAIWEKQIVERAKREATADAGNATSAQERTRKVDAELKGYRDLVGDAWVEGTPERAKVEKEFLHLIGLGHPSTKETEAVALRAAFGDLDTLRTSKSARPGPSDQHQETGGGKPPAGGGSKDSLKTLSAREREHYESKIRQGIYANWDAVRAELEYANPATRRRMGARA